MNKLSREQRLEAALRDAVEFVRSMPPTDQGGGYMAHCVKVGVSRVGVWEDALRGEVGDVRVVGSASTNDRSGVEMRLAAVCAAPKDAPVCDCCDGSGWLRKPPIRQDSGGMFGFGCGVICPKCSAPERERTALDEFPMALIHRRCGKPACFLRAGLGAGDLLSHKDVRHIDGSSYVGPGPVFCGACGDQLMAKDLKVANIVKR